MSLPGVEPGPRPSQSRVPPPHPKDEQSTVPHRGVEPRPAVSKTAMPPPHSQGDSDSNSKSRRLDSRQYQPVYKTGAFLSRATSAASGWPRPATTRAQGVEPCSAVLEATCFPGSTLADRRRRQAMLLVPKRPPRKTRKFTERNKHERKARESNPHLSE